MYAISFKSLPFAPVRSYSTYIYILKVLRNQYLHYLQSNLIRAPIAFARMQSYVFSLPTIDLHCIHLLTIVKNSLTTVKKRVLFTHALHLARKQKEKQNENKRARIRVGKSVSIV